MATPRSKAAADTGLRILICRPEPEASRLAEAICSAGHTPLKLPLMERQPLPETPEQRALIQDLDLFHHIIAVSPYAARRLLERIDPWWPQFPTGIHWYGIGKATAAVLADAGLTPVSPARGWTSEALLEAPELADLQHQRALIARGDQGRELLRETLQERGARVTVLPLYRRRCPEYAPEQLRELLGDAPPDAIIALSGETLNNLIALGENNVHNIYNALLVVPASRVAKQAREAGFRRVLVPDGLDPPALISSIEQGPHPDPGDTK
ncbi:uroporphyrinogen-III synthase [Marinobacter sp.]|uniref:uroporphyrinogen-III synthase n=1 Tax=Marinobacter sp. TaxID=50741 RepID=UPI0019AC75BB|nr:uroporphyrinogen-III synthase [Marinobacter sp.]MBC7193734.1 uroporphyrinogen-III synthase [Marinobacter sp.]